MDTSHSVSLNPAMLDGDTRGVASFDKGIVQRVLTVGVRAASIVDLVSIGFSRREEDVALSEVSSRRLLQRFQSLRGLSEASRSDLQASTGLEDYEILRATCLLELGRRMANAAPGPKDTIDCAADVADLLDHLRYEKREHFIAILLDTKNNVIRTAPIHVGTLNASIVGAREVFREAVREGAASVILVHNHPSGDPTPSPEDIEVTEHLQKAGVMLDIPVLDHVILGERRYTSLSELGLMGRR